MGLLGIIHTGLPVSDLDRSIVFQRDVLGLELLGQWDSAQPYLRRIVGYPASLSCAWPGGAAEQHIELLEYRQPRGTRPDANTYHPGNVRVSFRVDDLDAAHTALEAVSPAPGAASGG